MVVEARRLKMENDRLAEELRQRESLAWRASCGDTAAKAAIQLRAATAAAKRSAPNGEVNARRAEGGNEFLH